MKKIILILAFIFALVKINAQVNESDLIGNRFEICTDRGGLDGCEIMAKIKFKKNGIAEIQMPRTGGGKDFINGRALWQLYCNKNIIIYSMRNSFNDGVNNTSIDSSIVVFIAIGEITKKGNEFIITYPNVNEGNISDDAFEKEPKNTYQIQLKKF